MHVHTDDPGAVLTLGTGVGALVQVKIDNINRQAKGFVEMHQEGPPIVAEAPASLVSPPLSLLSALVMPFCVLDVPLGTSVRVRGTVGGRLAVGVVAGGLVPPLGRGGRPQAERR